MLDITLEQIESALNEKARKVGRDYVFQCPICKDRGKNNLIFSPDKGLLKCFSCSNNEGSQYVLDLINKQKSKTDHVKPKKESKIENVIPKWEIMQEKYVEYMSQCNEELLNNQEMLDFFYKTRGITPKIISYVGLGIDSEANKIVIPIFGLKEDMITDFEIRENSKEKIISRVGGGHSTIAVIYGLKKAKTLYIVEGMLDGYALLQFLLDKKQTDFTIYSCSNGVKSLFNCLPAINFSNFEEVKLMLDNDIKGDSATNEIIEKYPFIKDSRQFLIDSKCKDFSEWFLCQALFA